MEIREREREREETQLVVVFLVVDLDKHWRGIYKTKTVECSSMTSLCAEKELRNERSEIVVFGAAVKSSNERLYVS